MTTFENEPLHLARLTGVAGVDGRCLRPWKIDVGFQRLQKAISGRRRSSITDSASALPALAAASPTRAFSSLSRRMTSLEPQAPANARRSSHVTTRGGTADFGPMTSRVRLKTVTSRRRPLQMACVNGLRGWKIAYALFCS